MAKDIKRNRIFLIISSGMMEITWLYALAGVFFIMLNAPVFPIWAALLSFFTPIIVTSLLKGRGRRIIEHLIVHIFFYILILLYTIFNYGYGNELFFSLRWLQMFFQKQYGPIDGFAYILLIFSFASFWFSGYKLIDRSNDHLTITSRFDLGIIMLVLTFIIAGSTDIIFPRAGILISYYFLFSMLSIIIAQQSKSSKIEYDNKPGISNLIFTSIPVILLFASWVLLFFLPQMTSAAQAGYYILKVVANPIGKLLLKILSLLFGFNNLPAAVSSTDPAGSSIPIVDENELSWLGKILQWIITFGGILLFSILTILTIGWLLYSFWKWLSSKTELDIEKKGLWEELGLWLRHVFLEIKTFLQKYSVLKIFYRRRDDSISVIFKKLCQWGKHSGITRKKFQTPLEYGRCLSLFFPDNIQDIGLIIDGFNNKFYGGKTNGKEEIEKIKKAWRRLASPSQWPLRLMTKILYSKKPNLREAFSSHPQ